MKGFRFCVLAGILQLANFTSAPAADNCSVFTISQDSQKPENEPACLGGPVLGFIFSAASGQINPVLGIPGSMRLDEALDLGFRLDSAEIPANQSYALAVTSGDRKVTTLGFHGRTVYVRETALPPDPIKLSLSTTGNFAALFYPSLRQVYVVSQMPVAAPSWIVDASVIRDDVTTLSVSDDGERVLVGTAGGGVYSFGQNGEITLAANISSPVLTRFLRDSHDAVIADGAEKRLFYYSESAGNFWNFGSLLDERLTPLDIAFSNDDKRVFLVNAGSENIVSITMETGQSTSFACNCVPRRLSPIHGNSLFRITDVGDSSLLLFQPKDSGDEILFVPTESVLGSSSTVDETPLSP